MGPDATGAKEGWPGRVHCVHSYHGGPSPCWALSSSHHNDPERSVPPRSGGGTGDRGEGRTCPNLRGVHPTACDPAQALQGREAQPWEGLRRPFETVGKARLRTASWPLIQGVEGPGRSLHTQATDGVSGSQTAHVSALSWSGGHRGPAAAPSSVHSGTVGTTGDLGPRP